MKTLLLIFCAMLVNSSVQARIGETRAEIVMRYGPAIKEHVQVPVAGNEETGDLHQKNGISIWVVYNDLGRAAALRFAPTTSSDAFKEDEVQKLLALNGGESRWNPDASVHNPHASAYYSDPKFMPHLGSFWLHNERDSSLCIYDIDFATRKLVDEARRLPVAQESRLAGF